MLQVQPGILDIAPYQGGLSKAGKKAARVVKLSSNETPLGPSPRALEAYKKAADTLFRYPDGGSLVLRDAIAGVYGIDASRIVCGAGSDEIISLLCQAYTGIGSEVLYSQYGFLMYKIYAQVAGAIPVAAPEMNLRTDTEALLGKVTSKTRIVFLANPNNPTGSYATVEELKRLRKALREDILLVIDGAYAEYVSAPDYSSGLELVNGHNNVVMTRTFSKIYGLAGLRVGWAYCPAEIADVLNRVRGPFNVSSVGMEAAAAAVRDVAWMEKARKHNDIWLEYMVSGLIQLGLKVYPSVANFVLVEFPGGEKQADAANDFLMEHGYIPRKVASYGLPACLRITIGLEEDNKAVISLLREFISL